MLNRATPHPEVNELLDALTNGVRGVLGDQLVGAYLFGSATTGDFDRESDVDVVVVTADMITDETFAALREMHARIATTDSWCATQLEVSYIPRRAIRRYDPADTLHPRLDRGKEEKLHMMRHDSDWVVQRRLIREHGVTLLGPAPAMLIDPVSPDDLRRADARESTQRSDSRLSVIHCPVHMSHPLHSGTRRRGFQERCGTLGRSGTARALDAVDPRSVDRAPGS
jgi:predicted nucleotidyltransferase